MATEADIPARICETRRELGESINISINTVPQEEKAKANTPNELSTVEGENFLKTPSIGEVHCEVNNTSSDASKGTEKPDQTVKDDAEILLLRNPKLDDHPLDPGKQLEGTVNESHEDVEKQSKKTVEDIITNDADPTFSEKTVESSLIGADGSQMEHDEELENESEKLLVTEISTGKTNDNESAVIDKVKDEDEDICRAELIENKKKSSTLLKEDLRVIPEKSKSPNLGQDNETTSSSEEQSTNVNLHGITSDITEDKKIDAVNTQKEVLESFSTIVSSNPEEGSTNAVIQGITSEKTIDEVDIQKEVLENSSTFASNEETEEKSMIEAAGSETKNEELLEKESEKTSSPQPLVRETSDDEDMVMHEARIEDGEPRKAELCEIGTNTESMLPEIESKIEKPEDSLHVAYEDIKTSDSSHETETSFFEEKSATAHPHDGKTDDKALDAAEIKEEIHEVQNVQTVVSNEKTEVNSLIQVDGPQKKNENWEKDSEKPSLIEDLGQEIEASSFEEQSATAHSQIILDQKTEDKALDASETEVETLEVQNVSAIDSNEKTDKNSLIEVGGSQQKNKEHLEKDSEKPSSIKDFIGNVNDDELTVTDEVKAEDVNSAELLEKEKNIECGLLKEDVHVEKPVQSFLAVAEEYKASDLSRHKETTGLPEDQSLTKNPQGILGEKTEDETTHAVDTNEKTKEQQNAVIEVSNEDDDKNSSIQLDAPQMTHDTYLEKEIEKPPLMESSSEDINDKSTIMHEAEIGNESISKVDSSESDKNIHSTLLKKESSQEVTEDHKPSASSEDMETTCSIDEQSLTANPQSIMSDKTSDVTDTKEINLEHVATKFQHEHTEEDLAYQVDCSQTEHEEHLEKENENLYLTEASVEETNDNKSKLHEHKDRDEDLITAELLENERNIASNSAKEEAQVEKNHTESSQAAPDDIKASDSTHDTKMSSTEEEILTADPQEIPNEKREETTDDAAEMKNPELKDIATNILDGDNENNSLIEEDGSEKQSLKEVSLGKADDNVSAVTHEATFVEEHLIKADLLEKEKHEGTFVKEEVPIESLQVADEDIKASALVQDREKTSLDEQSLTTKSQGIIGGEDKTNVAIMEKESQSAATTTSYEDSEENSQIQVDVSQLEQSEHLERESENTPLTEAAARGTTENTLAKEGSEIEKTTDYVQVATEDIKATASDQDTEACSIKEQIPIANPQEIPSDKVDEKTIDATYTKEKTLEGVATKVPNWDNEDHLPNEVDGSQKPSLKEASMGNTNDDESTDIHEARIVDENLRKVNLFENEKNIECTSVEKKAFIESLQEANEDIKACAAFQDRETTSLVEKDQIMGDKEDKTTEATNLKEETSEEKNAATISDEDTEENSLSQVDSSQMEQKGHLQKESENAPLGESPTGDTTESTSKEEARMDKSIEYFQIVTGDIKASASGQDTEISSKEEQIPLVVPQEISCNKTEEKTTDASCTREELIEDIVTNVPKNGDTEDNPLSLEEASMGNSNDVESPITHEAKFEDETLVKADLVDTEKYTEGNLVSEKVPIDSLLVGAEEIKPSASSQERETSSLEVQTLTTSSQEITSNHKEQTIDATELEEETCQDKNSTIPSPYEDAEKCSLIRADCSQIEHNEHVGKEGANPSLTEAQTGDTTDSALLKEEPEMEKLKDSFQIATEDITASTSSQDTETCFIEEQIPTVDPQDISGDEIKEKIVDVTDNEEEALEFQDIAIKVPSGENEDNSPTEVDALQKPSLTEASTGNASDVQEIATNIPSGNNEDNSPTKVDGSQEPSLTEASTGNSDNHESKIMHEPRLVDENFLKADLVDHEKNTDGTLIKEDKSIESLQITTEDIKESASGQDRETSSQEEQSLIANPQEIMDNDREEKTIDATDLKDKVSKEKASESVAVEIPSTKDPDVNTHTEVDIAEDHNCKQEESSITTASEEHMMISNEHVANVTSSASEPSEQDIDQTNTEKITVIDDGSTKIPNQNLVETDPTESIEADARVPDEENKAELKQQDTAAGTSRDVSESNKLNGEEEGRNSNNLKDRSDSSNSVALEEISSSNVASETNSTSNLSLESRKETRLEAENEEAQKQDEDLCVSSPVQESSMEKIEKDVESCPASATDSEITQEMQKLEEPSLLAPDENTIENTDCKESDKRLTEKEQDETECKQEKVLLVETVEEITEPASIPVANDLLPKSFIGTSEIDHSTTERQLTINEDLQTGDHEETKLDKDKEEEAGEPKISNFSSAAPNIIEAGDKDGANRSIADLEAKIDDEAPEIIQTDPSATESREVESISVGETSASISECERDDYEHAHIGTEKKPDSNEFGFAPEESKSGHEAKNQVLESIGQVQSCGMISKAEENLEAAAAEIKSETVMVEDIIEPKETKKVNISSEKIKEEHEDGKNEHPGSCKEEAITESHLEVQPKQEEKTNSEEIFEVIRNAKETEKVSKVSEEADDKAVEEPEEKLPENESIDRSLHQKEQGKSVEDVTTISGTEEVHELDHSYTNTTTQDSRGEVNSSTVEFLEDEDKSTVPDDIDNEMAKDANTLVKNAVSGERPKRPDEHKMCEAPPAQTVPKIIEDDEGKKDNADTIMMQHQEEDNKSKRESDPLPEFSQGKDSEKHDQNDEIYRSDEVQTKDEVNLMLSAEKGEKEAKKEDTWSKPTEDEDKYTYVEAEKVDISSHTEDTTHTDATQAYPSENLGARVSSERQEAEATHKAPESETLEQEIEEQQLERTSEAVTKAEEIDIQEQKITDDDCNDLIENSSSTASEKISESNAHRSSKEDTARSDKSQESQREIDSLPISPVAKCSDIEIAEKDVPMQFSGLDSTDGTEPKETPIPSNDKHIVLEADHTKNINPDNSIGNKNIPVTEHEHSAECSQGEHELPKKSLLEPEEATCEHEEKTRQETTKSTDESESKEIDKPSLSHLFQASMKETSQTAYHSAHENEPTASSKDVQTEKMDEAEHEDTKTDEEESREQRRSELCSEAPVMVDMGDADVKVAHKKSHNILSGVGSKVKHSIAKVKKVITGKSSHPKPPSPK